MMIDFLYHLLNSEGLAWSENKRKICNEGHSAGRKLQYFIFFYRNLRTPMMSTDSSQVGVALFPSY